MTRGAHGFFAMFPIVDTIMTVFVGVTTSSTVIPIMVQMISISVPSTVCFLDSGDYY